MAYVFLHKNYNMMIMALLTVQFGQNILAKIAYSPPFHHPPNPEISYFVPDFPKKFFANS